MFMENNVKVQHINMIKVCQIKEEGLKMSSKILSLCKKDVTPVH